MVQWIHLECCQCGWQQACGPTQMLNWLRTVGMVRRNAAPDVELLPELFRAAAPKFSCPTCQAVGLMTRDTEPDNDEDWGMARQCADCGRAIQRERLEVFPDAQLCVECQGKSDRGESSGAAEYCPRCGSVMTLRPARRGVTRYVMSCPSCRT